MFTITKYKISNMETKICVFEENDITFLLSKDNGMMINATEMAKPFGKYPKDFMILDSTKSFIEEALKKENSPFIYFEKEEDLYISSQKSGTFMHRILALKFAAWLNPKFELWVYSTIEKLLFGKHVEREQSFERTLSFQKEMNFLRDKPEKTGEDFDRYLEIQTLIRREKMVRTMLTKENLSEIQSLFPELDE